NNLSVEPRSGRPGRMIVKKDAVKYTVNYVSDCSSENQSHAPQKAGMRVLTRHLPKVVADPKHRYNPEGRQREFAKLVIPPNAECHTWIEKVVQSKPFADHIDFFVKIHVLVDEQLRCLINYDDDQ